MIDVLGFLGQESLLVTAAKWSSSEKEEEWVHHQESLHDAAVKTKKNGVKSQGMKKWCQSSSSSRKACL